jgi:hypothetical protein
MTNGQFSKIRKLLLSSSVIVLLAAGCNQQSKISRQQAVPVVQVQPQSNVATPAPQTTPKVTDYVKYTGVGGKNALDLLKAKYPNQVQTKNYSGIGEFVQSIAGAAADSKHFWEFFVNGKSSNVGASSYTTKNGDVLEWKLSAIDSSKN